MVGRGILDSTLVSPTSTLRDSICDQDLRKLTRMRRHENMIHDSNLGEDRVDEQFGVAAAFCSARLGPVAGRQQSPDYAEERAQWRSSCSVILSQWALQIEGSKPVEQSEKGSVDSQVQHMEEPKPVVHLEKDGADSQAVIGFGSRKRSGSIVPGDLLSLPRPLSLTDLANAPTHGSPVRVAYQGVPGAYSELAAMKAYPECEAVPCEQFEAAFKAVELWLVDRAVLPIENSLGGSIHRNCDLLLRHRLHIVGEVQIPVNHCLLGLPGVRKEELRRVLSHRQALSQCKGSLSRLGVVREEVDDTASAAQFLAQNNLRDTGAVASSRAAEIYSLAILAEGIQDDPDNITRFLMLAREPIVPRTDMPFKTSIVFTLEEGPGVLFKALAVFALRDISLRKIESRPQRKKALRVVDDSNNGVAKLSSLGLLLLHMHNLLI